jgi:dihydrofolate synthase/folylpolyglutamate synthase
VTYRQALAHLFSLEFAGVKLGLDNITRFCRALDDPQQRFVSIHVAGTNGKGSVCAMIAAILQAGGYRVGRFTSPHLRDYRERIQVDGRPITRARVARFVTRTWPLIRREGYSYFETATAMAFDVFASAGVEVAVVEVGLGGRLDATSILPSSLSVITRIARDHERLLGRTPARIAREKAGIIRTGVPVLTGPLFPQAAEIIHDVARRRGATCWEAREILTDPLGACVLPEARAPWTLPLSGTHQVANLAVASAAISLLDGMGLSIGRAAMRRGVQAVRWPARFQVVPGRPMVVYDAAHNRDGIHAVVDTWKSVFGARRAVGLFTTRGGKDHARMAAVLAPIVSHWVGCPLPTVPGVAPEDLARVARRFRSPFSWCDSARQAMRHARALAGPDGLVLVTGSHFLVGAVIPAAEMTVSGATETRVDRSLLLKAAGDIGHPF